MALSSVQTRFQAFSTIQSATATNMNALCTPCCVIKPLRATSSLAAPRISLYRRLTGRRQAAVIAKASTEKKADETADEIAAKANELLEQAKAKWDETEEKPAVVAITLVAFIAVWAASALIDGIDKLPLVGSFFELVGLIVTGWFVYRYLIFGPDREELKKNIDGFISKVAGKDGAPAVKVSSPSSQTNGAKAEKL